MSAHAVMHGSDNEIEIGTCELERERPIVTANKPLRAFKIFTQYYHARGFGEKSVLY
jgi:hypothetical protein